jgi:hypothetical protein
MTLTAAQAADVAAVSQLVPLFAVVKLDIDALAGDFNGFDLYGTVVWDVLASFLPEGHALLQSGALRRALRRRSNIRGPWRSTASLPIRSAVSTQTGESSDLPRW